MFQQSVQASSNMPLNPLTSGMIHFHFLFRQVGEIAIPLSHPWSEEKPRSTVSVRCSTGLILWHFCSHFELSDLVLKLHLVLLWGDVSNSESSEFADLHCSGFESVIYKESKTSHVLLKSGFRMSLVFEAERSYENYILASSWLLGSV